MALETDANFDEWFNVTATVEWMKTNNFKRVALQLPDSLLGHAFRLAQRLKQQGVEQSCAFDVFVLADTSYGDCCVDQTSAAHNAADCVVHYGRSCLSRPTYLPTYLVFCDLGEEMDLEAVRNFAREHSSKRIYVELDVRYESLRQRLISILKESSLAATFSTEPPRELIPLSKQPMIESSDEIAYSQFDLALFVGPSRSPQLDRISFACATSTNCEVFSFNSETKVISKQEASRALARRFVMVEKCRDASIIGILIGTMSVALFRDVIDRVTKAIAQSGKKSYSFVFGKLNPSKLANFPDVDAFVLVACSFNTLIDSKEFNKPIVTPYELEVSLNIRPWGQYAWNFKELLSSTLDNLVNDKEEDVRFSLASGKLVSVPKKRTEVQTVSLRYESPAADSLASRTFKGLDPSSSNLKPAKATPGQVGTASGLYNLTDANKDDAR